MDINFIKVRAIIFDFDGIFTDNTVSVNEDGLEQVNCSRADGLGISFLKSFIKARSLPIKLIVLSKEKNKVVSSRCKKMKIKCYQGVDDKYDFLKRILSSKDNFLNGVVYLGNDLNDLKVMANSEYSVCPSDAHSMIKDISTIVLPYSGGCGFVRNFVEEFIGIYQMSEEMIYELIDNC
jgi:YrbI family 3-deoxy-D-manno-octulosonate 8-phosphate phosphatase